MWPSVNIMVLYTFIVQVLMVKGDCLGIRVKKVILAFRERMEFQGFMACTEIKVAEPNVHPTFLLDVFTILSCTNDASN